MFTHDSTSNQDKQIEPNQASKLLPDEGQQKGHFELLNKAHDNFIGYLIEAGHSSLDIVTGASHQKQHRCSSIVEGAATQQGSSPVNQSSQQHINDPHYVP